MNKVILKSPHGTSEIKIERGLMGKVNDMIHKAYPNARLVVITDTNLAKIYSNYFKTNSDELVLTVPSGEESKNLNSITTLAGKMVEAGIHRSDVVVGIGGGMITDLAGFLASIYMRGISYVAVPTSLLGMVDAAIGGKTGVNLIAKNILGTFNLADYVLIDPNLLKTMPEREIKSGMGEVIKYAYALEPKILDDLDPLNVDAIIEKSVNTKIRIVASDLKESNKRKLFNYGHTFGHAIEAKSGYALSHGAAISIGMNISNHIAQKLDKQSTQLSQQIKDTLEKHGLPTELPANQSIKDLIDLIAQDKKSSGKKIDFVIVTKIGKSEIIKLSAEELIDIAKDFK